MDIQEIRKKWLDIKDRAMSVYKDPNLPCASESRMEDVFLVLYSCANRLSILLHVLNGFPKSKEKLFLTNCIARDQKEYNALADDISTIYQQKLK